MNPFNELVKKVVDDNIKDVAKVVEEIKEMTKCRVCKIYPADPRYDGICTDCFDYEMGEWLDGRHFDGREFDDEAAI